ncbi:MAG TPA: YqiA/YcfP family alpha/beta fold hydrolase [Rhodocyclaceae bacterium]|nr:YqiA/YcfP family alpha/beta fold hydrolase [Rhodocyclaceae bacterium]
MILYLHGFRSGPQSEKVRVLAEHLAQRKLADQMWCEQLSPAPFEAITSIEAQIARCATPPTLVGSSLGGFYATWLAEKHGLRAALINPFVPHDAFDSAQFLGEHEMLYNDKRFTFTEEHVAQIAALDCPRLRNPQNLWLLAETGDEVLDYRYAVERYAGARQTVLEGGDHSFTRWPDYLDDILRFAGLPA